MGEQPSCLQCGAPVDRLVLRPRSDNAFATATGSTRCSRSAPTLTCTPATSRPRAKKPRTLSQRLSILSAFYTYLVDEEVLHRSPLRGVKRPKIDRVSPTGWLTRPQVADLLAASAGTGVYGHALVTILALNGLRVLDECAPAVRGDHPRITPHVLRHSWATLALLAGAIPEQVRHDGGWADDRMLTYYGSHGADDPARSSTHLVAGLIMGVG